MNHRFEWIAKTPLQGKQHSWFM